MIDQHCFSVSITQVHSQCDIVAGMNGFRQDNPIVLFSSIHLYIQFTQFMFRYKYKNKCLLIVIRT